MGAPSKRARKIRTASEFDISRLVASIQPPRTSPGAYSWSLSEIVNARNAQMAGSFALAARLSESMRTDDAIHVARSNRLAPQRCIKVELQPAKGTGGASVAGEAEALFGQTGIGVSPDTLHDIHDCLVVHSIAFAIAIPSPRPDGTRIDYALSYWPIEFVRWNAFERCFETQTEGGALEKIAHGDGRWVVFQEGEHEPFKNGALLAAAMVWARHAFAIRDWSKSSVAHGSAKVIGEMPAGVALQKSVDDGNGGTSAVPSDEAAAMIELLRSIASSDAPVGLRPAGSKTDFLTNTSTAWQIFNELVSNAERSAARIFLGTDGTLGANGGAPGVDISALFGVATTKVQGDLSCIERALQTGLIEVWTAVNFGDSKLAPYRRYLLPDVDADAERASRATRRQAFQADIKAARDNGFVIDQAFVDSVADQYDVEAPRLPPVAPVAAPSPAPVASSIQLSAPVVGLPGPPGPPGLPGAPGANGKDGENGRDGVDGKDGRDGADGFDGAQGPKGDPGLDGKDGENGRDGTDGKDGRDGADGANGKDGESGRDGTDGKDGRDGADGTSAQLGFAERSAAFQADLKDYRANGLCIDDAEIAQLAKLHGVPAPRLVKGV